MAHNNKYILHMEHIKTFDSLPIKDCSMSDQMLHMLIVANLTARISDYYQGCNDYIADALRTNKRALLIYRDNLMLANYNIQVGWRLNELVKKIEVYVREMDPQSCEILCNHSIWLDPAELTKDKI